MLGGSFDHAARGLLDGALQLRRRPPHTRLARCSQLFCGVPKAGEAHGVFERRCLGKPARCAPERQRHHRSGILEHGGVEIQKWPVVVHALTLGIAAGKPLGVRSSHPLVGWRAMSDIAISVEGVSKRFGKTLALEKINLEIPRGIVFGLLGPNGSGKSTTVRILATLLQPDEGSATVDGIDVVRHPAKVRERIGLAGQYAAVDEYLTGHENLVMFGRLSGMPKGDARARAGELLAGFDLADAADRISKTYSGGMRRRLDLASSLMARPRILFLDEPTTGLDPRGRLSLWTIIQRLVTDGTTVLLTTQYLEEADRLAQRIAVIDHGRVIADGSPAELKARVGDESVELAVVRPADLPAATKILAAATSEEPIVDVERGRVIAGVSDGAAALARVSAAIAEAGIATDDLGLRRPTLDEVFLSLTGHVAESGDGEEAE